MEGRAGGGEGESVGVGRGLRGDRRRAREVRGGGAGRAGRGRAGVWARERGVRPVASGEFRDARDPSRAPMENVESARRGDASRGDARGRAGAAAVGSRAEGHARKIPTNGRAIRASPTPRIGLGRKVGASRRCAIRGGQGTRKTTRGKAPRDAPEDARHGRRGDNVASRRGGDETETTRTKHERPRRDRYALGVDGGWTHLHHLATAGARCA